MTEEPSRPDPDRLLAEVVREEARAKRGRLRTFFGASAGVGKTYAMLEAARSARTGGVDVVVGYVEPHGRVETERLLEGLERLPTLPVLYRGVVRHEFDLDAALRRRAAITLVDELAHSNLVEGQPPPRHAKRWQDIEEMLDAGLDVWTTVNVQHLESLNDVVAGITGVRQQETIPDRIFDDADEIELIDLPPDDLLARLRAGKVYVPEQAAHGARAVLPQAEPERAARTRAAAHGGSRRCGGPRNGRPRRPRGPGSRGTACWSRSGPTSRPNSWSASRKRMADALDAEWTVVFVETPALLRLGETERNRRIDVLRLAESLGGETVTLDGRGRADPLLEYARTRNATRSRRRAQARGWRSWLRPSTDGAVRRARGIDVIVVASQRCRRGAATRAPAAAAARHGRSLAPLRLGHRHHGRATAIAALMFPYFELTNLVMVYLLGAPSRGCGCGRGPRSLAAVASVAAFDFFFVPPRFTFAVSDVQYLVTFAVMLTRRAHHRHPDGQRATADPRRRRARAAHGAAVCDEP